MTPTTHQVRITYDHLLIEKLNAAFKGVGMEQFIPDGFNG